MTDQNTKLILEQTRLINEKVGMIHSDLKSHKEESNRRFDEIKTDYKTIKEKQDEQDDAIEELQKPKIVAKGIKDIALWCIAASSGIFGVIKILEYIAGKAVK